MTDSLLQAAVTIPNHVVRRDFAAETVVLNLSTGRYHGLNPTAGRMLAVLEEADTIGDAAGVISTEFERPLDEVERDLAGLCEQLAERDLLLIERGA